MRPNSSFWLPVKDLRFAFVLCSYIFFPSGCATVQDAPVAGQELVFFPSPASVLNNGQWSLTIQGRIFKPTKNSTRREGLIKVLAPVIGVTPGDVDQSRLFRERAEFFLSDSEQNQRVSVKVGDEIVALPPSDSAGYFTADIPLSNEKLMQIVNGGVVSFESVANDLNPRRFQGISMLVAEEGVMVISDIDDTIKITNILNHKEKIERTFLLPFVAVPGMPELYRSWQKAFGPSIHFHIVSAGPWQFNEPLRKFAEDAGFPPFTWTMRSVDIGNPAVVLKELSANPYDFKLLAIRALMSRFPRRHVVLVGDSGEKDPEVYARIASEYANRVDAVYIRNVTGENCNAPRYAEFARTGAANKLSVFLEPRELPAFAPASPVMALCASKP